MFKKNDLVKVKGLSELEGLILKVKLVSPKLKGCVVPHKGINYTIPFEYIEKVVK